MLRGAPAPPQPQEQQRKRQLKAGQLQQQQQKKQRQRQQWLPPDIQPWQQQRQAPPPQQQQQQPHQKKQVSPPQQQHHRGAAEMPAQGGDPVYIRSPRARGRPKGTGKRAQPMARRYACRATLAHSLAHWW